MLLERLQAALHPDYAVEAPLAEGGMGLVFRARDVQLQRTVAIKVLRPELATAAFRERFLREARTLAGFRHSHIVSVHRAGESDGLAWYAMDLLEGETLADRLARGPLPATEARRLMDQILGALEAVHARGVVHRDIKPSNIFLAGGDAVVGDFGIAKSVTGEGAATALTGTGMAVGTPGYMPPEQATGGEVSTRTDVCAAGMLLYQMLTGRVWLFETEFQPDWLGVPPDVRPVLERALAWNPRERYADAAAMRKALASPARPRLAEVRVGAVVALAAAGMWLAIERCRPAPPPTLTVEVRAFAVQGGPAALGDAVAHEVVSALRAAPEITFRAGGGEPAADVHVEGTLTVTGDSIHAVARAAGGTTRAAFTLATGAPRGALADSIARQLLLKIWTADVRHFGAELPARALPRTAAGVAAWAGAELLYARAQWGAADTAYERALALDSTCVVCDFRLAEISRWLRLDLTTGRTGRLLAGADAFPDAQRAIIRAWVDPGDRFAALDAIARRWPGYAVGLFTVGDEFFHRGPLVGVRRASAREHFHRATQLKPDFAPAWEHYAWLLIAEGDSAEAARAFARYAATAAGTDFASQILVALVQDGFYWRFLPPDSAVAKTTAFLQNPAIQAYPDLAAGPRYLMSFDAPEGVVWLGERFVAWPGRDDLVVPGLVGQAVGFAALGRPALARAAALRLRARSGDAENALAAGALDVALSLDDALRADTVRAAITRTLEPLTMEGAATPVERRRALWLLATAERLYGDRAAARRWRERITDEPAPRPFGTLLDAADDADRGGAAGARRALERTAPLHALDSAGRAGDPLFRAVLHAFRADWRLAEGNPTAAVRELRWHENNDVVGHAATLMQAAEFDWALGTWARWRRAGILADAGTGTDEACRAWADVVRLWRRGEPAYAARAGMADQRRRALACEAAP